MSFTISQRYCSHQTGEEVSSRVTLHGLVLLPAQKLVERFQ